MLKRHRCLVQSQRIESRESWEFLRYPQPFFSLRIQERHSENIEYKLPEHSLKSMQKKWSVISNIEFKVLKIHETNRHHLKLTQGSWIMWVKYNVEAMRTLKHSYDSFTGNVSTTINIVYLSKKAIVIVNLSDNLLKQNFIFFLFFAHKFLILLSLICFKFFQFFL